MTTKNTPAELAIDQLGRHFSAQLSMATPGLPHDITERLRVARQLAMAQRKPEIQLSFAKNTRVQSNGTLTASGDEGLNLWRILVSALPLVALVTPCTTPANCCSKSLNWTSAFFYIMP